MSCDIIIPAWNQLEYTKNCLESIFKNTHYPYRLVIIDNASEQPTRNYLQKLSEQKKIFLLCNEQNLGWIKAINQGIKISSAPYICLMNNDTLTTDGWLTEMVFVAENNPQVGIVNPSSNNFGQKPEGLTIDDYALTLKRYHGQWQELSATGFCMLIKREIIDKVGFFDERYNLGYFEETDFYLRAIKKGFLAARAKAAYVYHYEKVSFRKFDIEKLKETNRNLFYSRWERPTRIAWFISKNSSFSLEEHSKMLLNLARRGHLIYAFLTKGELSVNEHPHIRIFKQPVLFSILKILRRKRRKRFDNIFSDDLRIADLLERLKSIHQAKVFRDFSKYREKLWRPGCNFQPL